MPTRPTSSDWSDEDRLATPGTADMTMVLLSRIRALEAKVATLETQVAANSASILTIQTRLGAINALLHLW